jgi:hypothetical protein
MKLMLNFGLIALGLGLSAAHAASVEGVVTIRITSTNNTWIQISEVVALDGSSQDVALSTISGVSTASSGVGFGGTEEAAINGIAPGGCMIGNCSGANGIYHSSSPSDAFFEVTLAAPTDIFTLSIFGRADSLSERDVFDVELFDGAGTSLFFATGADANNADHRVDVFSTPAPIPVPAAGWLLLTGLGSLAGMRRR